MWKDPIVTETRSLREQYARNADEIFQVILLRQASSGKKRFRFSIVCLFYLKIVPKRKNLFETFYI